MNLTMDNNTSNAIAIVTIVAGIVIVKVVQSRSAAK